jgi:hypothetical protein
MLILLPSKREKMPKPRKPGSGPVRTTVLLPAALWEAAKLKALKERTDLRSLIIAGLEAQLKKGAKP